MSNVMTLFSTPIYYHTDFCDVNKIHYTNKEQKEVDVNQRGNFITKNKYILECKSYKVIKDRILQGLENYTRNILHIDDSVDFYITQSWLNIIPPNTAHHLHVHSNSIISGVYYIDTPEDSSITFQTQSQGIFTDNPVFKLPIKEYNIINSGTWNYPVSVNSIIYFPSSTLHEVCVNTSKRNRISLAFNVFVKGEFGLDAEVNRLTLGEIPKNSWGINL